MKDGNRQILEALDRVEAELRLLDLWKGPAGKPHEQAFLSTAPFFLDTMDFHQWLEYVLLPKLRERIWSKRDLPKSLNIHPMAEEVYRGSWATYRNLINSIRILEQSFKRVK